MVKMNIKIGARYNFRIVYCYVEAYILGIYF